MKQSIQFIKKLGINPKTITISYIAAGTVALTMVVLYFALKVLGGIVQ